MHNEVAGGPSHFKGDIVEHKRCLYIGKQGVNGRYQARFGAPVFRQREFGIRMSGGVHIGKNVSPPEAVNRLLGVADQKENLILVGKKP